MDYRDERDALRGRVENLEQELGDAKRELDAQRGDDKQARIARIEKQMMEAQRMLVEIGRELALLRDEAPRPRMSTLGRLGLGMAVTMMTAGVLSVFVLRRAAPAPQNPATSPVAQAPARTTGALPLAKPPVHRLTRATWSGKVAKSTGSGPAAGTACTVEATLAGGGGSIGVSDVVVTCGGKALYRSSDVLEGMSMSSSGAEQHAGSEAGTFVYTLQHEDKGTRTGARNEASIDTSAGVGAVWRTSVPAFNVELAISPQSTPVRTPSLVE